MSNALKSQIEFFHVCLPPEPKVSCPLGTPFPASTRGLFMSQAHPLTAWASLTLSLLHKASLQAASAPKLQTPPPPTPGSRMGSQRPGLGEHLDRCGRFSPPAPCTGLDPAFLLSRSQQASDSTASALLLPNFPACPAITRVHEGSLCLVLFSTTTNWGVVG